MLTGLVVMLQVTTQFDDVIKRATGSKEVRCLHFGIIYFRVILMFASGEASSRCLCANTKWSCAYLGKLELSNKG